jgi:ribonuclease BN (tRNA processing enzyme)
MLTFGGKNIILDMGCGALTRVLERIGADEIDAVVLSHLHADHMGDVLTLRYALGAMKKLGRRTTPLTVYMPAEPKGEAALIAAHDMIEACTITDGAKMSICGMDAAFALMPHAVPSYAMAFCAEGKKFVYSGDTADNDALARFAKNADLFLIEAAFRAQDKPEVSPHVSAAEAARIGREAGAKQLLLTHIFPEYDEEELLREARAQYPAAQIIEELKAYEV